MPSRRETVKPPLAPLAGELLTCALCDIKVKYDGGEFTRHLQIHHEMTPPEYYLMHVMPGADICMCGCGLKTTWTPKTGGRFPDFIQGHHLTASRKILARDTSMLRPDDIVDVVIEKQPPEPGAAIPDVSDIRTGFLNLHRGIYTSLKTGHTHAYKSLRHLNLMQALDVDVIMNDKWDRCEFVIPYVHPVTKHEKKHNPDIVIYRDGKKIIVDLVNHFTDATPENKAKVEATSLALGCPVGLIAYQGSLQKWFIVWSSSEIDI